MQRYWFFYPLFLFFASCAGGLNLGVNGVNTSLDYDTLNALIHDQDQNPTDPNIQSPSIDTPLEMAPPTASGRRRHPMNGVAYVISKELSLGDENSGEPMVEPAEDSQFDFPELKSVFEEEEEDHGKQWRPRRGYDIPVVQNEKVKRWIRVFTGPLRSNYERWLGRASHYGPVIEKVLKSYDLPSDLIYLAMIESGFNLNAYSRAAASGPWQFIKSTGRMYGLKSGGVVDERRDIEKATRAAAEHLRDLYQRYGDWNLAFAAYNAGPGSVDRALRLSGKRDYWAITSGKRHYFRRETEDYVPRIYAAAIIAKHYKEYGFSNDVFNEPYSVETVSVPDSTDISVIAQCAEVSLEDIRHLNPPLLMGITPPGQSYDVVLPDGTADTFQTNFEKVPPSQRVKMVCHRVSRNETLAGIAKRYGVNRTLLAQVNSVPVAGRLRRGTQLMIPRKGFSRNGNGDASAVVSNAAEVPIYRVKRGDTLSKIAARHGTTVASLKLINGLGKRGTVRVGQVLKLKTASVNAEASVTPASSGTITELVTAENSAETPQEKIIHSVKRGETLWKVSLHYRVTVAQLKQWNRLRGNALYPNQKLVIYAAHGGPRKVALKD